ncbi:MAG: Hpt domain-containing protein [Pseudomonadales bacterium]
MAALRLLPWGRPPVAQRHYPEVNLLADGTLTVTSHLDLGTLRELREIMAHEFDDLIEAYLTDTRVRIDEVRAAIAAQDAYQVRELVHSLKGSCSNVGAVTLAKCCQKAENIAREGELEGVDDIIDEIQRQFTEVSNALIREIGAA